jgi:hypothetical protein
MSDETQPTDAGKTQAIIQDLKRVDSTGCVYIDPKGNGFTDTIDRQSE